MADSGAIQDEVVALQLRTRGSEVVRVAKLFLRDPALHRRAESHSAAEKIARGA